MPALKNQRQELFAQELARGKSPTESYTLAGYQSCRQNAHRLSSNDDVKKRVAELQSQREIDTKNNRDGETGQFLQGFSGNPRGRPRGSRNLLGEKFISDLAAEWERSGVSALERVSREDPVAFVKTVASVLPRELDATLSLDFSGAANFLEAFRLARRQVADVDDPLLLELQPDAAAE